MTDRYRAFRKEIRVALNLGVTRVEVAEVISALLDEGEHFDALDVRVALMQYVPASAFTDSLEPVLS